jgi:multidrug resistance efflux pump
MSSKMLRIGVVSLGIILAVAVASAQERRTAGTAEREGIAVFNPVEGRVAVISCRPDGARVEKGEVFCELDSSKLQDLLASEEITISGTTAEVHGASLAREVAVMTLNEYKDGLFIHDLVTTESEIKLAESNLARAEDTVDWTRRMFDKGYVSMATKVSEELALKKARFTLEEAQSKRKVLLDHTKNKTIKTLLGAVETARAHELHTQSALERQRSARTRLDSQLRRCKVAAPIAGRVRYASPIGAGAVLQDGQLFCRIVPDGDARIQAN